ncbi:MAG: HAD family hydrolase [Oligoflexia bacterium]|nr:HAD family hydrolase [Oligoflexia bacterium]
MKPTIFFDFGGCLDAPGIHTRKLFWQAATQVGFLVSEREHFQEAYTKADQQMMSSGEAKEMSLEQFNEHNAKLILNFLSKKGREKELSDIVTKKMSEYISLSKSQLEKYRALYEYAIISNFTGNLKVILEEYGMLSFFYSITESFYVGASKPDLKIFEYALKQSGAKAEDSYYIGDNPKNDIDPGNKIGFKTALIYDDLEYQSCGAKYYVRSLDDFFSKIQSK